MTESGRYFSRKIQDFLGGRLIDSLRHRPGFVSCFEVIPPEVFFRDRHVCSVRERIAGDGDPAPVFVQTFVVGRPTQMAVADPSLLPRFERLLRLRVPYVRWVRRILAVAVIQVSMFIIAVDGVLDPGHGLVVQVGKLQAVIQPLLFQLDIEGFDQDPEGFCNGAVVHRDIDLRLFSARFVYHRQR